MMSSTKFWDRMSKTYDNASKSSRINSKNLVNAVTPYLQNNDDVLEIACGTGVESILLSQNVKSYLAIDTSEGMINRAKQKQHQNSKLTFLKSNIEGINFDEFDKILSFNVLHLIEDRMSFLRSVSTHLNPEGYFVSITPVTDKIPVFFNFVLRVLKALRIMPFVKIPTEEILISDITAVGFKVLEKRFYSTSGTGLFIVAQK